MCGIAGILDCSHDTRETELASTARMMSSTLRHRGPDAEGAWTDARAGIAFGHQRLSIIDVSDAGAQPMRSSSGRYVLSYNGEIYNAGAIAEELQANGRRFRGHCDTEVLVEAIDEWGIEPTLERLNGMFAFALWDNEHRLLHLVRDRLGEKPLYYAWLGNVLVFGSELRALRAHPRFRAEIDRDALALFLRYGCVPAPWSIFRGVRKLPPATILSIDAEAPRADASPKPYWSVVDCFERATSDVISDEDATDRLEALLREAVLTRMRSDVPLGAFFSGGIDSSMIVALMQAQSSDPVRTFTIGNAAGTLNEADRANVIAQHLGTRHTELLVTPEDALGVIPRLPAVYDEPFGDPSQIPTLLVAEMARRDVKVGLSGDGGDEIFGGYNRYRWVPAVVSHRSNRLTAGLRRAGGRVALAVPPSTWDRLVRVLPPSRRPTMMSTKVAKFATIIGMETPEAMYRELISQWEDPNSVVIGGREPVLAADAFRSRVHDPTSWMMATDTATYLPDDILVKLDRATMSVGLEARVPFLDHRVVEFAAGLPLTAKIRHGRTKWLLRQVLRRHVPERLFERPKSGFGVPLGEWLRGPLRDWADALLSPERLQRDGYLRPEPVRAMWEGHLRRRRESEYPLWAVLMFQAWLETLDS